MGLKDAQKGPAMPAIYLTKVEKLFDWGRKNSIWPLPWALACCGIEMMATYASRFDLDRFGILGGFPSPRQCDAIVVAGTVTKKIVPVIKRLYQQMPEPKYVIAMGNCANSGGIYYYDSYNVVKGVDTVIPVDVYIPGCPPRPEALVEGFLKLQEKILRESAAER